jgi:peptidoglycan/LPS O-acetylase OafA/YrhL
MVQPERRKLSRLFARDRAVNRLPSHLPVLDGWRGISILLVLAAHLLPLGPKFLEFNDMIATTGMSLFFILSGFLVVSMLIRNDNVASFLVRRACRILPLAWGYLIIVLSFNGANWEAWERNLLFYANLPPYGYLKYANSHFWSLSVEMQFYAAIALVVALTGRWTWVILPIVCLAVTTARIAYGIELANVTWFRVDEILAGGILALAFGSSRIAKAAENLPAFSPFLLAPLLLASCHPSMGALNYARPYLAALLVGSTILRSRDALQHLLCGRILAYIAKISFALYVIHRLTASGWMDSGDVFARYSKRIVSFILSFLFAHISTFYYEKYWIGLGHRLAVRIENKSQQKHP